MIKEEEARQMESGSPDDYPAARDEEEHSQDGHPVVLELPVAGVEMDEGQPDISMKWITRETYNRSHGLWGAA